MREEIKLYLPIGIDREDKLIMIDYFFSSTLEDKPFFGVTGSHFDFYYPETIEAANDIENIKDNYGYLWQEEVANGMTEESLDVWAEEFKQSYLLNGDGIFISHDTGYLEYICDHKEVLDHYGITELWDEEQGTLSCSGGGRMFSKDDEDFEHYFTHGKLLHDLIRNFEGGEVSLEDVYNILIDNKVIEEEKGS